MSGQKSQTTQDIRAILRTAIAELQHTLPGQGPIKDFVHHNTLHGYEHLPFNEALAAAKSVNGNYGYLRPESFRKLYKEGRITSDDLCAVIDKDEKLDSHARIFSNNTTTVRKADVYLKALCHPIRPISNSQLNWQIEEFNVLMTFHMDVPDESRQHLMMASARRQHLDTEADAIFDLSNACLEKLDLTYYMLHPEDLLEMDTSESDKLVNELSSQEDEPEDKDHLLRHRRVRKEAERLLQQLLEQVGSQLTLRGLLKILCGEDILENIQAMLVRHVSAYLDYGVAAWHHPHRDKGFYHAWRKSAEHDPAWLFDDLGSWSQEFEILPDTSLDAIVSEFQRMALPLERWADYLQQLALELPGWSGMFLWRHNNTDAHETALAGIDITDYLAVRLVMERIYSQHVCSYYWKLEARLDILRQYFLKHRSEFMVRYLSHTQYLPEYLRTRANRLIKQAHSQSNPYQDWVLLADQFWVWRHNPMSELSTGYNVLDHGWRLFILAQHLGLCGDDIRAMQNTQLEQLFHCLDAMDEERSGFIWLQAYEHHYREQLYNAISHNVHRGRWQQREHRPRAQLVFCMDDREEGIRRHLEEINPQIETFGAAGFFGVAINWKGLDADKVLALCPVVVTPEHEVQEIPKAELHTQYQQHRKRQAFRLRLKNIFLQEGRRNLLSSAMLMVMAAPLALFALTSRLFMPFAQSRLNRYLSARFDMELETEITLNTGSCDDSLRLTSNQLGFSDEEQADRVETFLRTIGMTHHFAPFIVMVGHGSYSLNNPHLSAYDCGACSGRHGGPNARVFAAMANRKTVRERLKTRGLDIPDDSWFLGCEHNTADDVIHWYDLDTIPAGMQSDFASLEKDLKQACLRSAHERCRRFASAPPHLSPLAAYKHVNQRSWDISQARPELGHATNAAAFVGRRSITQGAFWDRRAFLISYTPAEDPDGRILENILLAVGPVGAGINLEYYFSTVNNDNYGCGSKVMHNIVGLYGVMEGSSSDLRTGLPQQMIEIHEAMRLQLIVEATTETLTAIYQRQASLQQLVGNGWILLTAMHPETGELYPFDPASGFSKWQGQPQALASVAGSRDWYEGHSGPLPFALIDGEAGHAG